MIATTEFPTEPGWIGDDPDPERPAGREMIEVLLRAVAPEAPLSEIWNHEGFGWGFNTRVRNVTVNVLVQFLDHWLVIVDEVSLRPRFLRGRAYDEAVLEVCTRIHAAFGARAQTTRIAWMSENEYERSATP